MRRVVTCVSILSFFVTGLSGLGSIAAPGAAAAGHTTTIWKLVNRTCTGNEVEAGRACFDPAGHADGWNSVNEGSADGKVNGEKQDYTYDLPDVIGDDRTAQVNLHAEVSQVSDGGAHARICLSGPFGHKESGDPCATTTEAPNGQSATADATLTLVPYETSPGTVVTMTIGFEEPGGYVNFNYQARAERHTVLHHYSGTYFNPDPGTRFKKIHFGGSGSFKVTGPLGANMPGTDVSGTATWRFAQHGDTHTVELDLKHGFYTDSHEVDLTYKVTNSNLRCLPVGHQVDVEVFDRGRVHFGLCGDETHDFRDDSMKVQISLS